MAKPARQRAMPRTPQERPTALPAPAALTHGEPGATTDEPPRKARPRVEREFLITGTGCVAGHPPGKELDAGRIGRVPTKKQSWTGFGLLCWCLGGLLFLERGKWVPLALQIAVVWLAFAAIVVRSAGHRRRCWRTRTWRHAWGGLVPTGADPTRPAGT